eukprot:14759699-Alexandrium_andersonii.AAC.1
MHAGALECTDVRAHACLQPVACERPCVRARMHPIWRMRVCVHRWCSVRTPRRAQAQTLTRSQDD